MSLTYDSVSASEVTLPLDITITQPNEREPRPGDLVAGRYQLLEVIGEGGMARVFRGRDERLARDVAVKIGRHAGPRPPLREERVASTLFHPHIVAIFDGGTIPPDEPGAGADFIVMEHVVGGNVFDVAPVDWQRAAQIALQAADGLAAAHARGIIHNDIKPSNLLLDTTGNVKLADFGAAATTQTEVGEYVHGSPAYVAPERLRGARPDPRQDVYGLGGVLAFLLSGHHPEHDTPPRLPAGCPRAVAGVVERARALDPGERHADAASFRDALAAAASERGVVATGMLPDGPLRVRPPRTTMSQATPARARRPVAAAPSLTPRGLRRSRLSATVAALGLALLLTLTGGVVAPRVISNGAPASPAVAAALMPDVTGQTVGAAVEQLAGRGLTVERVDVVYGSGPLNQVIMQVPAPGQELGPREAIVLIVRTGR